MKTIILKRSREISLIFFILFLYKCALADPAKTIVVKNKSEFLSAVSPKSPYQTVIVEGIISDLSNVQLKDNLNLKGGQHITGALVQSPNTIPKENLLILGRNDRIEDIQLVVHKFNGNYSISDTGKSIGSLNVNHVKTNGEISINIIDGSKDSTVNFSNNQIKLNNEPQGANLSLPAGIELSTQEGSFLTVEELHDNDIQAFGLRNTGIYTHAYSKSTIQFNQDFQHNNIIVAQGKQASPIYNLADNAVIHFKKSISYNVTQSDMESAGIFNNTIFGGNIIIDGGLMHNLIKTTGMYGYGIENQAQTNGRIQINTGIQYNTISTIDVAAVGFQNCAGRCDSNAGSKPKGQIDLSHAKIINNTITTQYDGTPDIANSADGNGAIIDYGQGSVQGVTNYLTQNNALHHPNDIPSVTNFIANGGVIT